MRSKEVRKPSKWWIIRVRAIKSYDQVAAYLGCDNAHHAGHNGWGRKYRTRWDKKQRKQVRVFKARRWNLRSPYYGRGGYRFSELSDARGRARIQVVKDWVEAHEGFVEIVEREGCEILGTITSEKVVHRMFVKGTNEMVILALESL